MKALNCTPYAVLAPDIIKSEGCTLWDGAGRAYTDLEAGVWCAGLGHGHPAVAKALARQMEQVAHVGYRASHPVVEEAAGGVLEVLGMEGGQCLFLSAGSEAVEFALRAAQCLAGAERPKVVYLEGYFLSAYGQGAARPAGDWLALDVGREDWRAALDGLPFEEIGVFVLEPGNASGLVRLPPKALVEALAEKVQAQGGLLVVDEVTTGMGRTGKWWGFEHYDVTPDIVACGKGLGNGYPVSCAALREGLAGALLAGGFRYAQSHQNDPLGCAVACAVLEEMRKEDLPQRANEMGRVLLGRLEALAETSGRISEVRGRGLLVALTLAEEAEAERVHRGLFERGFLVGVNAAANVLRLYPPLVITRETIDAFAEALAGVLAAV